MSNKLPNASQFADRRPTQAKPTQDQINQQLQANIAQMRLNLSTQFLNTLIANGKSERPMEDDINCAVDYADGLLIRLGIAQRQENENRN
jgi:hypothetical protein